MNSDWVLAIFSIGALLVILAFFVVLPMFNAYLEYRMQMKSFEKTPIEVHGPIEQYEERLQRDNDEDDPFKGIRKPNIGTSVHDEKLPL